MSLPTVVPKKYPKNTVFTAEIAYLYENWEFIWNLFEKSFRCKKGFNKAYDQEWLTAIDIHEYARTC